MARFRVKMSPMSPPPDNDRDAPTRQGEASKTETATGESEVVAHERASASAGADVLETVDRSRYRFFGERGRGGIGRVMVAHDSRLDRRVAVKELLKSSRNEARFVREAFITARLQHPGIVPIIEAGRWDDGEPFYSMKLVEGESLKELIAATGDLDARFALVPNVLAVADTIAYAHSQRVIHRDLKPSNVVVGEYGETIVVDWGLAKDLDADDESDDASAGPAGTSSASGATAEGTVLGTLAYMPPEQARGEAVDERADVFAIGALLYHVLSGSPPLSGDGSERLERARASRIEPLAERAPGAPADLVAIVTKAMSPSPESRYATARELAADLRRFTTGQLVVARDYSRAQLMARWLRANRTRIVVVGLAAVMLAVGTIATRAWYQRRTAAALCGGADARLAGVWDDEVRGEARAAFEATGASFAGETFARVDELLDSYTEEWGEQRRDACMLTRHRGEQSARVMDLRMRCFERRRAELDALTDVLAEDVTSDVVLGAIDAVAALTELSACDDIEALSAAVPPPDDPEERDEAERLRAIVDRAGARYDVGRFSDARELVEPIIDEVNALGYAPLEADATYALAEAQLQLQDHEAAMSLLLEVLPAAARAHDDHLLAAAQIDLMAVARTRDKADEALAMRPRIELAIARADDDEVLQGRYWTEVAASLEDKARYTEALVAHERALELFERAHDGDHMNVAAALHNLGMFQRDEGNYDQARALLERSRTMYEAVLGLDHPDLARVLTTLGTVARKQGKLDEAWNLTEHAMKLREAEFGSDHTRFADSLDSLGKIANLQGKYEQAYELHQRALAIYDLHRDARPASLATILDNLGTAAYSIGNIDEALVHLKRSVELMERLRGPDHPSVASTLSNVGAMLLIQDRYAEASEYFERAATIQEAKFGPDHPGLGATLTNWAGAAVGLGQCERGRDLAVRARKILVAKVGADNPRAAVPMSSEAESYVCSKQLGRAASILERALELTRAANDVPDRIAGFLLQLAQVEWDRNKRARSLELAAEARALYAGLGEVGASGVEEVDEFLADKK